MLDMHDLLLLLMLTLLESCAGVGAVDEDDLFVVVVVVVDFWINFQAMRFQQVWAFDVWTLVRVGSKIYKYHQLPVIDILNHDRLMYYRDYMRPSLFHTQKMDD